MKKELQWISLALWWVVLIGFLGPFLISADSTIAVIAGFLLILGSAYATYRIARRTYIQITES